MATVTPTREDELRRLRAELEQADIRLEEVTAYYRGQLEAIRRRAEDETVRVQASEAGRRRRAEEQVAYLKGELKAARTDAEHAQRRYQELLQRLENIELEGREQTQAEVDRHQVAAQAAWRTAEEEVARLDTELSALQRRLEQEREERHQLERAYEQLEERHQLQDQERRRLIGRLKRGFKLSEQRRMGLEAQLRNVQQGLQRYRDSGVDAEARSARGAGLISPELASIEVDPAAGWGSLRLGDDDALADEFLMMSADESLDTASRPGAAAVSGRSSRTDAGEPAAAMDEEEVSDQEAEALMMQLDVDRKVAQRQADAARRRPPAVANGPVVTPPMVEPSFFERWKWGVIGGACAGIALVIGAALVLF